jgi:8-oxo-dGTP pyrophosphatase MutT (NUDIX family)
VLRGRVRPRPLSGRLARLAEQLAAHRPTVADDPRLRWAAVAIILVPDPDTLLLIRRAERPGDPWSGHMALPGGRRSSADADLLATAIRETEEEVGVRLEPDSLIGVLDDVAPQTPVLPPVAVRPFVFALPEQPALTLNREVASAAWVELDTLLHPDTYRTVTLHLHGAEREVQGYQVAESLVWGMTERILRSFFDLDAPPGV